ncbi:MAG: hypothetical protein ACTSYX_10135 [Candidatus Thorarchaeota archaeon]
MEIRRLILPVAFCVVGIALTFEFAASLTSAIVSAIPGYDVMPMIPGGLAIDVSQVLRFIVPVTIIVYFLLSLPIAFFYALGNRMVKIGAYTQGIVQVGKRFGAKKIIYRAVAPAMFSLTFGQSILAFLPDFIIREPSSIPPGVLPLFAPLFSILSSLVVLTVALALYAPTWLLNDSGIVYHLKSDELATRRCPDMMGVGRWVSNFLGGYSLLGYPVSAFFAHFYKPFVMQGVLMTPVTLTLSAFWTVGMPLLVMAFVLPVILVHEIALSWMRKRVHRLARMLGAKHVDLEELVRL